MKSRSAAVFAALSAVLALSACARKPAFEVAHTYVVRGRITQLPLPGKPYTSFMLSHEAIPDFFDADGVRVGMQAMVMSFACSDRGLLKPLAVGDKVRMRVVVSKDLVDWDIMGIEKLDSATALALADDESATPPPAPSPAHGAGAK